MPFRHIPGTQQTRGTNDTSIREWYIWRDLWTIKYETDGFYHILCRINDYKPYKILENHKVQSKRGIVYENTIPLFIIWTYIIFVI